MTAQGDRSPGSSTPAPAAPQTPEKKEQCLIMWPLLFGFHCPPCTCPRHFRHQRNLQASNPSLRHFLPRTQSACGVCLFTLQVSPEASSSGEGYHLCSGGKESKVYSAACQNPQTYQAALKRNDRKVVISTPGISTHSYLNNGTWKSLKPQRREKSPSETSCLLGSQSGQA